MSFHYTDRNGELVEVGADCVKVHDSGALIFWDGDYMDQDTTLVVAPGDWHDLTVEDDQ